MDTHNFKGLRDIKVERLANWCDSIMQTNQSCVRRDNHKQLLSVGNMLIITRRELWQRIVMKARQLCYSTEPNVSYTHLHCRAMHYTTAISLHVAIENCLRVCRPHGAAEQ